MIKYVNAKDWFVSYILNCSSVIYRRGSRQFKCRYSWHFFSFFSLLLLYYYYNECPYFPDDREFYPFLFSTSTEDFTNRSPMSLITSKKMFGGFISTYQKGLYVGGI